MIQYCYSPNWLCLYKNMGHRQKIVFITTHRPEYQSPLWHCVTLSSLQQLGRKAITWACMDKIGFLLHIMTNLLRYWSVGLQTMQRKHMETNTYKIHVLVNTIKPPTKEDGECVNCLGTFIVNYMFFSIINILSSCQRSLTSQFVSVSNDFLYISNMHMCSWSCYQIRRYMP